MTQGTQSRVVVALVAVLAFLALAGSVGPALAAVGQDPTSSTVSSSTTSPTTAAPTTEAPTTTAAPTTSAAPTSAAPPTSQTRRTTTTQGSSEASTTIAVEPVVEESTTTTSTPELLVPGPSTTAPPTTIVEGDTIASDGLSSDTKIRFVVAGLLAVAVAVAVLTILYWRHTRPLPPGAQDWADDDLGDDDPGGDELDPTAPLGAVGGDVQRSDRAPRATTSPGGTSTLPIVTLEDLDEHDRR